MPTALPIYKNFIPRALNKLKVLPFVNYQHRITIQGTEIIVPIIMGIGFSNLNLTEPWMTELLRNVIPLKEGAFIDVGVNLGQTLLKVKSLFPQLQYIGFEPNPSCVFYCQELIRKNHFTNCSLIPAGLSDSSRVVVLNGYGPHGSIDSAATIIERFRPEEQITYRQFVSVYKFSDVTNPVKDQKIGFIKIDVEGAELETIEGLKPQIIRDKPFISCEILPAYNNDNTFRVSRQKKIEAFLNDCSYSIFRVLDEGRIAHLEEIGVHGNMDWCEYLFVPHEDLEAFTSIFKSWLAPIKVE